MLFDNSQCSYSRAAILIGAVGFALVGSPSVRSEDKLDKQTFLKLQKAGEAASREFYSQVKITAVKITRMNLGDANAVTRHHEFYRAGDLLRLDGRVQITKAEATVEQTTASVANEATGSFRVRREFAGEPFKLIEAAANYAQLRDDLFLSAPYAIAPFGFMEVEVKDLFATPGLELGEIEEVRDEGRRAVIVHFRRTLLEGKPASIPGWIKFLPDRNWAVLEWSTGTNRPFRGKIEYTGDAGPPLVKAYHVWIEDKPTGRIYGLEDYEITSIERTKVDGEMFKLASFGIR
jgi:hypothetical protein